MALLTTLASLALVFGAAAQTDQRVVVFDIDGTLTPAVHAIGTARPDAAAVVAEFAQAGFKIVDITARIPLLRGGLDAWLQTQGFPAGDLSCQDGVWQGCYATWSDLRPTLGAIITGAQ